jgi:cytoskeletal protein CcmA (bactofilin family)
MDKGSAKGLYTMIGEGSVFEGTLFVPHDVRIEGTLKSGKLTAEGTLTVGPTGIIDADVDARSAIVAGKITGNLSVEDRVELEPSSILVGNLKTRELVINEGAVFQGNCTMSEGKKAKV